MVDRRQVLKTGAALALGAAVPWSVRPAAALGRSGSWLDHPASECPVDTFVALFLENRSFDHMLGWLGRDEPYLERGRRRYGRSFAVNARTRESYRDPRGFAVETYPLVSPKSPIANPWRGCGHKVPGHGWNAGRVQLRHGFLAEGSGNDVYALGHFDRDDVPVYRELAYHYAVSDAHFASLLGETIPNRMYIHAATSGGAKDNPGPLTVGQWPMETIWDRLERAGVTARFYYSDFPYLLAFGERMADRIFPIDQYLEDCANGTLPNYAFLCPQFGGPLMSDAHPRGDINLAQRFALTMFRAFAESPQWERGLFKFAHDEWGGFWDHVQPPQFADERASAILADDFGQAGFRVPSITASPWIDPGSVHSVPSDHTAFLRMLEWRFLGAPARGVKGSSRWWLTERDHAAPNLGSVLTRTTPRTEMPFDLDLALPMTTPVCGDEAQTAKLDDAMPMQISEPMADYVAQKFPPSSTAPWADVTAAQADPTKV